MKITHYTAFFILLSSAALSLNAGEFVDATEQDYRNILNAAPKNQAGPLKIRLNPEKNKSVKVEVFSPLVPNLTFGYSIHYQVDAILSSAGENVLPKGQKGKTIMRLQDEQNAIGSFSLRLESDSKIEKYTLKGKLTYMLPLEVETVDIASSQIGQQFKAAGDDIQLTFLEIKRKSIALEVVGPRENILMVQAFDAQGNQVKRVHGGVVNRRKKVEHHVRFAEVPASIRVFVASKFFIEDHPFVVEHN